MFLPFEKWHGCENDFVVTWVSDLDADLVLGSLKRQASPLCHRRRGIGADGILVLRTESRGDLDPYALVVINQDGSVAKNCGNGIRCAALSVLKKHREDGDPKELPEIVEFDLEGAPVAARFLPGKQDPFPLVAVDMGVPALGQEVSWSDTAKDAVQNAATAVGAPGFYEEWEACEIGNPHVVFSVREADPRFLEKIGAELQTAGSWDGINVHLMDEQQPSDADQTRAGNELGQTLAELYRVLPWERGVGPTPACGSGACAAAACAAQTGLVERSEWIGIDMPGGRLYVKWEEDGEPITLAGPGTFVYSGHVEI